MYFINEETCAIMSVMCLLSPLYQSNVLLCWFLYLYVSGAGSRFYVFCVTCIRKLLEFRLNLCSPVFVSQDGGKRDATQDFSLVNRGVALVLV